MLCSSAGAAYVFVTANSGSTWSYAAKLSTGALATDQYLGRQVAVSGDIVAVGADGDNAAKGALHRGNVACVFSDN